MQIDSSKCISCRKCINKCPVKYPNKYTSKGILHNYSACISCGECIDSCSMRNNNYIFNVEDYSNTEYCILIHPSFKYSSKFKGFISRMNNLKFTIYDGGFGGDMYLGLTHNFILSNLNKLCVGQLCPTMSQYFQKYGQSKDYIVSPVVNPIELMTIYIKNVIGDKRKILLISPCISYEYCVDKLVLIKNLGTYSQFILDDRINCPSVLGDYLIISGNISKCFEMLGYSHNILELNNVSTHDMNLFLSGNNTDYFIPMKCNSCINDDLNKFSIFTSLTREMSSMESKKLKTYKEKINSLKLDSFNSSYFFNKIKRNNSNQADMARYLDFINTEANFGFINCGMCGYNTCKDFISSCLINNDDFSNCKLYSKAQYNDLSDSLNSLQNQYNNVHASLIINKNNSINLYNSIIELKSDIELLYCCDEPEIIFDFINENISNIINKYENYTQEDNNCDNINFS